MQAGTEARAEAEAQAGTEARAEAEVQAETEMHTETEIFQTRFRSAANAAVLRH